MIWSLKFWGSLFTQNVVMPELQASWIVFHFSLLSLGLCCSLCPKWHTWPLLPDECIFLQLLNSCFHDLQHIYRKVYIFIKCFMHWPLNNLEAPTPAHLKTEYNFVTHPKLNYSQPLHLWIQPTTDWNSHFDPQLGNHDWECENTVFHMWLIESADEEIYRSKGPTVLMEKKKIHV